MIDQTTYSQLQQDVGHELAAKLLSVYLSESKTLIETLITTSEPHTVEITAHSLKSSSRSYGALQLADICENIEHQVKCQGLSEEVNALILVAKNESVKTFADAHSLINSEI